MSKEKKKKQTPEKELSEWQKRNQEYLQKKAEEEAKQKGIEASAEEKKAPSSSEESDQELSEWQKQHQEYLQKKAEEEAKSAENTADTDSDEEADVDSEPESDTESEKEEASDTSDVQEKQEEQTDTEKTSSIDSSSKDKNKEKRSKVKKEKKPKTPKPPIRSVHIWRAVSILVPSFLILFLSIYLLTPFATLKQIEVTGTVQTNAEQIKEASGIRDSDYTISLILNKDKHAELIKSNYWVESASIQYKFPAKFTIEVKEFGIVAYSVSGENYYPILSSGEIESTAVSPSDLPETFISVLFTNKEQIKTLISELSKVSSEIKDSIDKIELAPSKVTSDLLKITMRDTDEILVPLSELGKKLPYYSKIKPQLTVPSGIDMEVGIYSYSLVDKALDDERVKAKEEEKKKQEEEKKKQAEQGNQDQTTQTTQTTQSR